MPALCGRRHFWRTEMLDEYPKALYRGDKQTHEHVIADGEEHEAHLRSTGYVDYLDLDDAVPEDGSDIKNAEDVPEEIDLDAYVPVEQFDAVAGKLVEAEEQLAEAKSEFHSRINDLQLEKQKLEEELNALPAATGVPQDVYDAVYQEREQLLKENAQYKYSAMSAAELRAVLEGKGIKYGSRDEKPALVKLVLDNQ